MNNNENKKQDASYKLEYTSFEDFNPTMEQKTTTTHHIASLLNARLKPAFQDYHGCFIEPIRAANGGTILAVTLTFDQLSENQIKHSEDPDMEIACGFRSISELKGAGTNIAERNRALTNELTDGRRFDITPEAKSALGDLISRDPKKINWKNITGENYESQGWTRKGYCYVRGIDFNRVLEIIFGSKEGDSRISYNAFVSGAVSNSNLMKPNNWILNIQRMTDESAKEMCASVGYISTGTFNCVEA